MGIHNTMGIRNGEFTLAASKLAKPLQSSYSTEIIITFENTQWRNKCNQCAFLRTHLKILNGEFTSLPDQTSQNLSRTATTLKLSSHLPLRQAFFIRHFQKHNREKLIYKFSRSRSPDLSRAATTLNDHCNT